MVLYVLVVLGVSLSVDVVRNNEPEVVKVNLALLLAPLPHPRSPRKYSLYCCSSISVGRNMVRNSPIY